MGDLHVQSLHLVGVIHLTPSSESGVDERIGENRGAQKKHSRDVRINHEALPNFQSASLIQASANQARMSQSRHQALVKDAPIVEPDCRECGHRHGRLDIRSRLAASDHLPDGSQKVNSLGGVAQGGDER
jgi:hypothetical protein